MFRNKIKKLNKSDTRDFKEKSIKSKYKQTSSFTCLCQPCLIKLSSSKPASEVDQIKTVKNNPDSFSGELRPPAANIPQILSFAFREHGLVFF